MGQEQLVLDRALASLSERSIQRRAKVIPDVVTLGDVPVGDDYVEQVKATGATVRRESKWLNAVSVESTEETIERIKRLDCVREVRPFQQKLP